MTRWTREQDAHLLAAYEHQPVDEIAAALGRTNRAVVNRAHRLGVCKKVAKHGPGVLERICAHYTEHSGKPVELQALADEMGVTRHWIARKAREMGLTDPSRDKPDRVRAQCRENSKRRIKENGHPRGMAGKHHSQATRARLRHTSRAAWDALSEEQQADITRRKMQTRADNGTLIPPRAGTSWKQGWHEVGGRRCFFRSSWEVSYANYLEWLKQNGVIVEWAYEPETFWFESIKRGTRSYTPDFRIENPDGGIEYHEVKGWMDQRSRTKIKRMAKYHPDVRLIVIDAPAFRRLRAQLGRIVPGLA